MKTDKQKLAKARVTIARMSREYHALQSKLTITTFLLKGAQKALGENGTAKEHAERCSTSRSGRMNFLKLREPTRSQTWSPSFLNTTKPQNSSSNRDPHYYPPPQHQQAHDHQQQLREVWLQKFLQN